MKTLKELAVELSEGKEATERIRAELVEAMKREGLTLFEYEEGKYVRLIEQHVRDMITFPRVVTREDIEKKVIKNFNRSGFRDNFDDAQ